MTRPSEVALPGLTFYWKAKGSAYPIPETAVLCHRTTFKPSLDLPIPSVSHADHNHGRRRIHLA